jgi:nucleotide-binding universal stress UspA family protein
MATCTPVRVGFERILVPIDFSDASQRAIDYAQSIARSYDSEILLAQKSAEPRLEDTAAQLRSMGFAANAVSLAGGTRDQILSTAQRENADLIVLGIQGRTGVSRLFFGSDAESLYRQATCPILVVGPAADPAPADTQPWQPRDIVCASDLDPDSVPVAAFASQLAEEHGAAFTILHVEDTYENKDRAAWLARFKRAFSEFLPGHQEPSYIWRTRLSEHALASTITDFASVRHSHLIVLGAQSTSSATSRFSSGITPQILAKAPCPVMLLLKQ